MRSEFYPLVGETVYEHDLTNGLKVFVFHKPDFQKTYAFFATRYGGMDTRFHADGQWHDTPMGIAHYLEHKMFDMPDGNALMTLSAAGASPNAFTGSAMTAYHFECVDGFEENLRTLLNFVTTPYFTEESVNKERGIIEQEIRMVEDNPYWQLYHGLMEGLYVSHTSRNSVAGTVESIAEIDADTLYRCHKTFYNPANMVLCVAGNASPETVVRIAEEVLSVNGGQVVERDHGGTEPETVNSKRTSCRMPVARPLFQIGFKLRPASEGQETLRQELLGDLASEVLMGQSSPLYRRMYDRGIIDPSFFCGCSGYPGAAFVLAGGESDHPEDVAQAILEEAQRVVREGLNPELFERVRKAEYGVRVRALNNLEHLCREQAEGFFNGKDAWRFPEIFRDLKAEDVEHFIADAIREEVMSMSVVEPLEAAQ